MTWGGREDAPLLAIIANSVFPYGYDAVRVLGLRQGSLYRARFDKDFVSDDIKLHYRTIVEQPGFYCFRDFGSGLLIPLRMIEILEITLVGSVYYIEYTADTIFSFPNSPEMLAEQIRTFNTQFGTVHKDQLKDNNPGSHLMPLVLFSALTPQFQSEETDSDEDLRRWAVAAKMLGQYDYFKYVPFIRIVSMRGSDHQSPRQTGDDFVLRSTESYRLQLAHKLESDLPNHSINENRTERAATFIEKTSFRLVLRGDPKLIDIQEPTIFITGEYDVNHFYFRTKELSSAQTTTLTIDYEKKPDQVKNLDTSVSLAAHLRPSVSFPFRRLFICLVFLFVYLIPNFWPFLFQDAEDQRLVKDLSIIALCLTCFGLIEELRRYWGA